MEVPLYYITHACICFYPIVFAYVGGTYFFLVGSFNFVARLVNIVVSRVIKFMHRKAEPHVSKIRGFSIHTKRPLNEDDSDEELLDDNDLATGTLTGGGASPMKRPLSSDDLVNSDED